MKQHYKFLQRTILLLSIMTVTSISAQNIQLTFANAQNTNDGTNDFYEADIMIQTIGGLADFKLGSGQLYFNYNTVAFGTNVRANNKIQITASPSPEYFLGEKYVNVLDIYDISTINDNGDSRVSWAFSQIISSGSITQLVGSTARKLIHIKIQYTDVNQSPNIAFEDNEALVNAARDQFYTACGPYDSASTTLDCDLGDTEPRNKNIQFFDAMYDSSGAALGTLNTNDVELAGVSVFPIPAKDIVAIKGLTHELSRLEVYNFIGQLIKTKTKNLEAVHVNTLSEGVYFLKLYTNKASKTVRFVKN